MAGYYGSESRIANHAKGKFSEEVPIRAIALAATAVSLYFVDKLFSKTMHYRLSVCSKSGQLAGGRISVSNTKNIIAYTTTW